ncbi:MAG: alpha/beta fold hydrolase [Microbacteriaceae bacterium]|nr:alpha/beta fold hydrolase [Microbacteriaceae bacterium]
MPASRRAPASLPPLDLAGFDRSLSRIVRVAESDAAEGSGSGSGSASNQYFDWHITDTGVRLTERGLTPVGTILCVHGNPTWSYLWRRLVAASLRAAGTGSAVWRVVAVDQLDMGFSERTGTQRPLARRVADLSDLTDALKLDGPVVTLGHDWGGVVSLGWAVDHPQSLVGVMLLNTAIHQPEENKIPAPLRLALRRSVLKAATVATPAFLETTLALAHPPLPQSIKEGYRAPYRGAQRRGGIGGFVADIPTDSVHESWPELERIAAAVRSLAVPTLMLWGPRDPIFSDRYLDDLSQRMPHADVHRFETAGHLVAEDVDYASALLDWLDERGLPNAPPDARDVDVASVDSSALAFQPLWHHLDEQRENDETALVEMAPPSGSAPLILSWRQLATRVRQLAAGLNQIGVCAGDRVSLLVPPGADLTAVLYACLRIGAIVVVADAGLGVRGLTRAVRGARPDHVIGATKGLLAARVLGWPGHKISVESLTAPVRVALQVEYVLAEVEALGRDELLPPQPQRHDTAAVLFTSGSTGPAKGVVYTHDQLAAVTAALAAQYTIGIGTGLVAGFAPFALLAPALGARSVTPAMDVTSPKTLTAQAVAAAVAAVDATVVFLSPAALTNVVATAETLTPTDHRALAGVKTFLSAGAPVSEPLLAAASRLMPAASAHTPYGMTEGLLMTDISLAGIREASGALEVELELEVKLELEVEVTADAGAAGGVCVGRPNATTRVLVSALDSAGAASGQPLNQAGVTGEIVVSAPHLKSHYDRLWITNRASRVNTPQNERWHRTGDVGHLDTAGRLWIEGRLPHVVVTAFGVVTPVGVEQRVETDATIARSALVGVGPRGTQQLVLIVETVPNARRAALASPEMAAAARVLARVPIAAVLVVPHLPTDIRHNSKIDRTRLSIWAARILAGGRMAQP